jgi:hypothetical protein
MGDLLGHAVRFGVPGDVMAAGEGIETMLSLRQILPDMAMAPAPRQPISPPSCSRRRSADSISSATTTAGDGARDSLIERANADGIEAIVLSPALGDFNEDLRTLGIDASGRGAVQLAPEDVARFMALAA